MTDKKERFTDAWGFFTAVPESVIEMAPQLGAEAFLLFCYLRYMTNRERGCAWPSYDTIQKATGLRRAAIAEALNTLEHVRLLKRHRRFGASTEYELVPPPPVVRQVDCSSPTGGPSVVQQVDGTQDLSTQDQVTQTETPLAAPQRAATPPTSGPEPDPISGEDDFGPEEPFVRVPAGQEFDDESNPRGLWRHPKSETVRAWMAPFKRKSYASMGQKQQAEATLKLLTSGRINEEWIAYNIEKGSPLVGRIRVPRWSFDGFLKAIGNLEEFGDWSLKRANAGRGPGNAGEVVQTVEDREARYGNLPGGLRA
jgi:hypothetical protein